jgi:hypothetical protein
MINYSFQEIYIKLKDFDHALEIVKQGAAYFQQKNEIVLVCYFGLIKCLVSCRLLIFNPGLLILNKVL